MPPLYDLKLGVFKGVKQGGIAGTVGTLIILLVAFGVLSEEQAESIKGAMPVLVTAMGSLIMGVVGILETIRNRRKFVKTAMRNRPPLWMGDDGSG